MRSQLCQIETFTRNMGWEEEEVFEQTDGVDVFDDAVEDLAAAPSSFMP